MPFFLFLSYTGLGSDCIFRNTLLVGSRDPMDIRNQAQVSLYAIAPVLLFLLYLKFYNWYHFCDSKKSFYWVLHLHFWHSHEQCTTSSSFPHIQTVHVRPKNQVVSREPRKGQKCLWSLLGLQEFPTVAWHVMSRQTVRKAPLLGPGCGILSPFFWKQSRQCMAGRRYDDLILRSWQQEV